MEHLERDYLKICSTELVKKKASTGKQCVREVKLVTQEDYRSCPNLSISSMRKSMSDFVAAGFETTIRKKLPLSP